LTTWDVEEIDGTVYARGKRARPKAVNPVDQARSPDRIVIVGGGAAGFAAAEQLRRRGYQGSIVMTSDDAAPPVDRPNLSKDYLAGTAPEDWIPLRSSSFYEKQAIDLRLGRRATKLDVRARELVLDDGETLSFDRLLLATGAQPNRLPVPGGDQPHIHTLRTLADSRAIIEQASVGRKAVVVGASFMGLEVAAALRERGLAVHIVAPAQRPLERVFGPQMGDFIRSLHEEHGVVFHLQQAVAAVNGRDVHLKSGEVLTGDLIIAAVGVKPRIELAQQAGLPTDRGVVVDRFLETSAQGVFAAGDIARWPDPRTGELIRVEHWVVAQRQGQVAALNMLDRSTDYSNVPFFWSQHYDVRINYIGHAEDWDELAVDGDIAARDCILRFKKQGRVLAAASIFRDLENLEVEMAIERSWTFPTR
jgi:NADPH-dependent 2,4-dienoyl-CoA reductase/sulfur reductase-like enzyme